MGRDLKTTSCTASLKNLDYRYLGILQRRIVLLQLSLVVAQGVYEKGGGYMIPLYRILLSKVTYIILSKIYASKNGCNYNIQNKKRIWFTLTYFVFFFFFYRRVDDRYLRTGPSPSLFHPQPKYLYLWTLLFYFH